MQTQHESYPEPPDYEAIKRQQWPLNAAEVPQLLESNDPYVVKKVTTYSENFKYPEADIKEKITNDPMFSACFSKDPNRTSLHEKTAYEWLKKLSMIKQLEKLPANSKDSIYVTSDGQICKMETEQKPSKSLDFRWKTRGYKIYASHKYTKQAGGNQNNQFREIRTLLEHFNKKIEKNKIILLAIVDGKYYNKKRMEDLRRFCNTSAPLSWALPIGDVPEWLDKHCV